MDRKEIVTEKLLAIPEKDWILIAQKCKTHIKLRIGQKTLYGAHSEKNLNGSAFEFYFHTAMEKLYSGSWDWQFEKFSIVEQLIRIIDSIISEEVRKYKCNKDKIIQTVELGSINIEDFLKASFAPDNALDKELMHQNIIGHIEKAIKDDFDLQFIFECFREGKSYAKISEETGLDKIKLYKLFERFVATVRSYFKTNNLNFEL